MTEINLTDYKASHSNNGGERTKVAYVNAYLKNDGDSIIVRFPYQSKADIKIVAVHNVDYPGAQYKKNVECVGLGGGCPFCAAGDKVKYRFLVRMLLYVQNAQGGIDILPAVWDRPAAFASIDLADVIEANGEDLSKFLFKIKRNGTGLSTTYTLTPIMNTAAYPDSIYVADFSLLNDVDPKRIFVKPLDKYLEATGAKPVEEVKSTTTAAPRVESPAATTPTTETAAPARPAFTSRIETSTTTPAEGARLRTRYYPTNE